MSEFQDGQPIRRLRTMCRSIAVSRSAVIPFHPSIPGPSRILTSSSSPALRKAALIVPPPTIAMRSTPNSVCRISTALCRSIFFSPHTIHEICRESKYARYSFVTSVDIMTINGESPFLWSYHSSVPLVSTTT